MTSFRRADDERFLNLVRELKKAGADVSVVTSESYDPTRRVRRQVVISWDTHNDKAVTL